MARTNMQSQYWCGHSREHCAVMATEALDHLDAACTWIDAIEGRLQFHQQGEMGKRARRLSRAIDALYYEVAALRSDLSKNA
jgi:hypothetical protein